MYHKLRITRLPTRTSNTGRAFETNVTFASFQGTRSCNRSGLGSAHTHRLRWGCLLQIRKPVGQLASQLRLLLRCLNSFLLWNLQPSSLEYTAIVGSTCTTWFHKVLHARLLPPIERRAGQVVHVFRDGPESLHFAPPNLRT